MLLLLAVLSLSRSDAAKSKGSQEKSDLLLKMDAMREKLAPIHRQFHPLAKTLAEIEARTLPESARKELVKVTQRLEQLSPPRARPGAPFTLAALSEVERSYRALKGADAAPTPAMRDAAIVAEELALTAIGVWRDLVAEDLPKLNRALTDAGLPAIELKAN